LESAHGAVHPAHEGLIRGGKKAFGFSMVHRRFTLSHAGSSGNAPAGRRSWAIMILLLNGCVQVAGRGSRAFDGLVVSGVAGIIRSCRAETTTATRDFPVNTPA